MKKMYMLHYEYMLHLHKE